MTYQPVNSDCRADCQANYLGGEWQVGAVELALGSTPKKPDRRSAALLKITTGATILLSLLGVIVEGNAALQNLRSKTEQAIANTFDRPFHLGHFRGLSHRGIHLGKTLIPPSETDALSGQIAGITIAPDWGALAQRRELNATVTLVRPEFWVTVPRDGLGEGLARSSRPDSLASSRRDSATLETLYIQDGTLTVDVPDPDAGGTRSLITIHNLGGTVRLLPGDEPRPVTFALRGGVDPGEFHLQGTVDRALGSLQATVQVHQLPITGLNLGMPSMITLQGGWLNGTVALGAPLPGTGSAEAIDLQGTVTLEGGQGRLGQQPAPIYGQSTLAFQGQRVTVANTRLGIGFLTLSAEGSVDLHQGYDLVVQVPPVAIADLQAMVGNAFPLDPTQQWQWRAQVTGPLRQPMLTVPPDSAPAPGSPLGVDLSFVVTALGITLQNLPPRDWIPLIEDAAYEFRGDGAWFTLRDGTLVPPLSEAAYQSARAALDPALSPALDRKFFWFLQTSPYVTAIAADLAKGKLQAYRVGERFDTDRFFLEHFIPVYQESSRAAGLDPGEALWMLDHSLRTLHDPLLRHPDARPITTGSGIVGSFWEDEQLLSLQQLIVRPFLAKADSLGHLTRLAVLKYLNASTSLQSRRLSSTPEILSKLPNVTYGAEEGAIALALGIMQLPGSGMYSDRLRTVAAAVVQNEQEKQALRSAITGRLFILSKEHTAELASGLHDFGDRAWTAVGLGLQLFPGGAAHLTGNNTLSVLVSRQEKAGYSLEQAYQNSRALLLEMLHDRDQASARDRILFAVLKDHALSPRFWQILSQKQPALAPQFAAIAADTTAYRRLAQQGATLQESLYAAMVQENQDIGVSATIKQAVGFQAHLAELLDQAFAPSDPADPRYHAFRRSIAIYLREAPDISVYGGTEAALRAYGQETLNVQELVAVNTADAPRIRAFARLYQEARATGLITEWDVPGFQRILLTGALLAAGVERQELPAPLQAIGFPSPQFRRDLLFVVGIEGIQVETTRLGVQAHDYRVSFQPIALPGYRAPAFEVTDPESCPSQPQISAIALGPAATFTWDATTERVILYRGNTPCPLPESWTTIFFPALLETVPIEHSEAGRHALQTSLREAQRLEAGIF